MARSASSSRPPCPPHAPACTLVLFGARGDLAKAGLLDPGFRVLGVDHGEEDDEINFGWRAVQPFLDAWAKGGVVQGYEAGTNGPRQADALLARDGRSWRPVGQ
jgi:glucose-6-phosphate 1-dehydrogenase